MKVVVLSCTQFGHECIENGILKTPEVTLGGVLTTPRDIAFSRGKPLHVSTHADFHKLGERCGFEVAASGGPFTSEIYHRHLDRWQPDLVLVLGWYYIVPTVIIESVPFGCMAIHASLLPKYRGMAPISWAIINGEKETGVSLFYLEKGVDTGDIVAQKKIAIERTDTVGSVYKRVTDLTIKILKEYLPQVARGEAPRTPQEHDQATIFPRRNPEDGLIDWSLPARQIFDFIRAQTRPYPGAFSYYKNQKLHIWRAAPATPPTGIEGKPGSIVKINGKPGVVTGEGVLLLQECQFESEETSFAPADQFECGKVLGDVSAQE